MTMTVEDIAQYVRDHRCYTHKVFDSWAQMRPDAKTVGALFHQIQCFCASTRPGGKLPEALAEQGLDRESHLLQEIVESEENHGPDLATMAGFIINRAAGKDVCEDVFNQEEVEAVLKKCSDEMLGTLPSYDKETGLAVQTRKAIEVFDGRQKVDRESTFRNLGVALALEMISNRQLIPGEKRCLVDSGHYDANLDQPEMHYLMEHWGEAGAEEQHEKNAIEALKSVTNEQTLPLIMDGVNDFLESLASLWDLLDSALLGSGQKPAAQIAAE